MTVNRPVLRYFGGKWLLAPWIIEHMPAHRVYVEPYGGAGSVLLRKPRSYAEVYNDLDGDVVNLFRVLQSPLKARVLEAKLRLTPFARQEFDKAYIPARTKVERARRLIIRAFMGHGSDGHNPDCGKTGFRSNSNRSGTTPAHDWANWPQGMKAYTQRLQGVVIEQKDALEVMARHDSPETLHFVDPPYPHGVRGRGMKHSYRFEMTDNDHWRLCEFLRSLKGMVLVCGYRHPIYEGLGWAHATHATHADGARDRTEVIWFNRAVEERQAQQKLL